MASLVGEARNDGVAENRDDLRVIKRLAKRENASYGEHGVMESPDFNGRHHNIGPYFPVLVPALRGLLRSQKNRSKKKANMSKVRRKKCSINSSKNTPHKHTFRAMSAFSGLPSRKYALARFAHASKFCYIKRKAIRHY